MWPALQLGGRVLVSARHCLRPAGLCLGPVFRSSILGRAAFKCACSSSPQLKIPVLGTGSSGNSSFPRIWRPFTNMYSMFSIIMLATFSSSRENIPSQSCCFSLTVAMTSVQHHLVMWRTFIRNVRPPPDSCSSVLRSHIYAIVLSME